jgi:hypothetical protein
MKFWEQLSESVPQGSFCGLNLRHWLHRLYKPVTGFNVRYLTTLSVSQIVERLMNGEL